MSKGPLPSPPPRKSTQLACIYTEDVYVATSNTDPKRLPIARVNFHYKLYEFHFGREKMIAKVVFRDLGDME